MASEKDWPNIRQILYADFEFYIFQNDHALDAAGQSEHFPYLFRGKT